MWFNFSKITYTIGTQYFGGYKVKLKIALIQCFNP